MSDLVYHVHHALDQVRNLRHHILAKQRFKGYSGWARGISGTIALGGALLISVLPPWKWTTLLVWLGVMILGIGINYGALTYWFLFDPHVGRDLSKLKPAREALPSLLVGGALSLAMLRSRLFWPLYGIWMTLYGLTNISSLDILPRRIVYVGLFYGLCGTVYLLSPNPSFLNPWPMGTVFFMGEWAACGIMEFDEAATDEDD